MKFAFDLAVKTALRKPFRSLVTAILAALLAFSVFAGGFTVISLRNGLDSYQKRLGADIVVTPNAAKGHGTVDDILLQGVTGNYYMSQKEIDKIAAAEGVAAVSQQFFLTSAKASCCSTRVQIIGFDPETDFTVLPWIAESRSGGCPPGEVVVGANINVPADRTVTFYGQDYPVAAQLESTGTGLDAAVYADRETVVGMAKSAARLLETSPFQGVDIATAASAVLIKVAEGVDVQTVADDINIHVTKVQATPARSMVSGIAQGLQGVSGVIGVLIGAVWALALIVLIVVFALLSNERKKEFAVLRAVGASRRVLTRVMACEAALVSGVGALVGAGLALLVSIPLSGTLKNALSLPFLRPGAGVIVILFIGALILSVLAGLLTAGASARKITGGETGLLLREDT